MPAQLGSAFALQKGSSSPYTDIGGFRTRSLTINSETVDVTTADDSGKWRQLLAAAGIKTMSVSGGGVIKDTAAQQALATDLIAQTVDAYLITVPGLGTFAGSFQITTFEVAGEHNGEITYNVALESGGDITYTAEGV